MIKPGVHTMPYIELELLPGAEWEDVFKTPEEYQEFRDRYCAAVEGPLKESEHARALSWHECLGRCPLRRN